MATQVMAPPPMKLDHDPTAAQNGQSGDSLSPLTHSQSLENLNGGGQVVDDEVNIFLTMY